MGSKNKKMQKGLVHRPNFTTMAPLKKKKMRKGKNKSLSGAAVGGGGEEDRITGLPDCLIHHILSFLLIKDVVRTSALSKRWNCIFTSNPTLDFRGLRGMGPKEFMDAVGTILHLHDMSKIRKFVLSYCGDDCLESSEWISCEYCLEPSIVSLWINAAVKRNVEKLELEWVQDEGDTFQLPLSLFTCESLTKLNLHIYSMYLPKYMSCPRLKYLELRGVEFCDEYNNEQLFSGCPVLEELILEECDWSLMKNFCISAPALKILKILSVKDCSRLRNVHCLRGCGLKIDAPNLVSLTYKCDLGRELVVSSLQSLVDADLDFYFDGRDNDADLDFNFYGRDSDATYKIGLGAAASRFFQALSHVKCLSISNRVLRVLSFAEDFENHLPMFHHLKQLKVEREASTDKTLIALLQSAPNLESLVFKEYIRYVPNREVNPSNDDDGLDLDMITTGCLLLQHLKSVSFEVFSGRPREMSWAKLISKNAKVLQTMTFNYASCTHYPNVKSEEEFLEELQNIFHASEDCDLQIASMDCPHTAARLLFRSIYSSDSD